jgi:large subunit ribosomal protein L27
MLGIKLFGGQAAQPGSIICRQNGTKWHAGKNVAIGRDWTIYSLIVGTVKFDRDGRRINVVPPAAAAN